MDSRGSRRQFLRGAIAVGASVALGGAARPMPKERPNILLLVSEDNGPELGCYGDPYAQTPTLDRLASEGVRFANASVPYSVCSPSRAAYLTGLWPHQNGQIGLATHKYAMYEPFPNAFSLLKGAGYRTGIIGKLHVNPESAFPIDFRWNPAKHISFGKRNVREIAAAAGGFMREGDEPFFLNVNFPDAHFPLHAQQFGYPERTLEAKDVKPLPWIGADSERLREYTANYYNCLARLDAGVGLLLEELSRAGKADNTLIVYLGDHGAQFSRGKTSVYEAALRVPLIVHWPGRVRAGVAPKQLVSTIDILPTLLEAAGIEPPRPLPGRALQPLLAGRAPKRWRRYLYGFTNGSAPALYYPQFSIRDERYKLILSPLRNRPNTCALAYRNHRNAFFVAGTTDAEIAASEEAEVRKAYATYERPPLHELYDLEKDPHEFRNVADDPDYNEVKERLLRDFESWRRRTGDPLVDARNLERMTQEHDRLTGYDYRGDKEFRWGYLDYFRENVGRE